MTKHKKRDFAAEIKDLLKEYPELIGGGLPKEVVDAAMKGMSLKEAYEQYMQNDLRGHAPVTGTVGYGTAMEEDDFLRGFNS